MRLRPSLPKRGRPRELRRVRQRQPVNSRRGRFRWRPRRRRQFPPISLRLFLTVWVPPEFDPNGISPAAGLLRARIRAFEVEYDVRVQVRVKEVSGPGSLLEALTTAGAAAPLAMPSVIALPRPDLEVAAIKGLIVPLDGLSSLIDEVDWYAYSRDLAMVQGATFALPFAGDALVLVYRPAAVITPPDTWQTAFRLGQPLAFPAGDSQALLPLTLYRSLGGQVEDAQRRPVLAPEVLTPVLQLLADGEERGIFPFWLSQYETYEQVWQAYIDQRVNVVVAWSSSYLHTLPADSTALALPALGTTNPPAATTSANLSLAVGWGWAVADPIPERRLMAARLAEFLTASDFLAQWSEASGYLPTRPSALEGWTNSALKTAFSPITASAQARPSTDLLSSQGPVLKEAVLKMLKRESSAPDAAQAASDRLTAPQSR